MDNSFLLRLGLDTQKLVQGVNQSNSILQNFQSKVMGVASTLGVAFSVQQVGTFALELTKLAGVADGVKQAFLKIRDSSRVLEEMRSATKGTVSELELMKGAVQASNFGIPIQQLGSLFEFAYERAKATGQSVDYLVNSIIVGIGRKSPLILDNLGISAVQLKEKLHGVSTEAATVGQVAEAVGKIAEESMAKTGKSAETAAEKIARLAATWENIKVKLGEGLADKIADDSDPNSLLTNMQNQLIVWGDKNTGFWTKLLSSASEYAELVKEIQLVQTSTPPGPQSLQQMWEAILGPKSGGGGNVGGVGVLKQINEEIKRLTDLRSEAFGPGAVSQITAYNKQIETLKNTLEALNKAGTGVVERKRDPRIDLKVGHVPSVRESLASLNDGINEGPGPEMTHQAAQRMAQLQERADKLSHSLKVGLTDAFVNVSVAMGQFFAGADSNLAGAALDSIGNMAIQLGGLLIAEGVAVEAFKTSLENLEGGVAIAAGVALVAAGSAFKSAAASIAGSGSGASVGSRAPMARPADQLELRGQFRIEGADLIYVLNKQGYRQSVVGG